MIVELWYDDVPPSLNEIGTRGSRWEVVAAKTRWQSICSDLLGAEKLPRGRYARARATAMMRFPQADRADEGNFRWMLEKALGDALVAGGWLRDDTSRQFSVGPVALVKGKKKRTIIDLELWLPAEVELERTREARRRLEGRG